MYLICKFVAEIKSFNFAEHYPVKVTFTLRHSQQGASVKAESWEKFRSFSQTTTHFGVK